MHRHDFLTHDRAPLDRLASARQSNGTMSRLSEALSSVAEIHAHLAKAEVYRGLQAKPVALCGLAGLFAAGLMPQLVDATDGSAFIWYWIATAVVCALLGASGALVSYCLDDDNLARRRARIIAGQFLPCVIGGLLMTLATRPAWPSCVGLFPGLWSVLFGLGLFSSRPYLPRATGWVALYHLAAGIALLWIQPANAVPSPWSVGLVFCLGQLGLAAVLHRNAKREVLDAW
jgi:hypothetical protein